MNEIDENYIRELQKMQENDLLNEVNGLLKQQFSLMENLSEKTQQKQSENLQFERSNKQTLQKEELELQRAIFQLEHQYQELKNILSGKEYEELEKLKLKNL